MRHLFAIDVIGKAERDEIIKKVPSFIDKVGYRLLSSAHPPISSTYQEPIRWKDLCPTIQCSYRIHSFQSRLFPLSEDQSPLDEAKICRSDCTNSELFVLGEAIPNADSTDGITEHDESN